LQSAFFCLCLHQKVSKYPLKMSDLLFCKESTLKELCTAAGPQNAGQNLFFEL
jgi:hypothetical protein